MFSIFTHNPAERELSKQSSSFNHASLHAKEHGSKTYTRARGFNLERAGLFLFLVCFLPLALYGAGTRKKTAPITQQPTQPTAATTSASAAPAVEEPASVTSTTTTEPVVQRSSILSTLNVAVTNGPASLISPTPNSTLTGSSQTFTWTAGVNATAYRLYLGTTGAGKDDLYNSGSTTETSVNVSGLPTNGVVIYAELSTEIRGRWRSANYTFVAASPAPMVSISSSSVSFGSVTVNTATIQSITLSSTGTAPVTISSATVTGTGFSVSGVTFPVTLNPNQTATLNVQFDPTSAGAFTGQLAIVSNSSINSSVISLSGTGVPAMTGFSCANSSMTGTGTDTCTVTLNAAAPTGGFTVALASNNTSATMPASATVAAGATSASFSVAVSTVSTTQTITLTASAGGVAQSFTLQLNAAVPTLSVNSSNLSFGSVAVNSAATQSITLSSTGTAPVTVNSVTVSGAGFSVSGASFPLTLNPSQTATLSVRFNPTSAGSVTSQLIISSNSSTNASAAISLSGTGTPLLSGLACTTSSFTGSGSDACTVTLNAAAAAGGFAVSLSSNNSSVTVPSSVTVASGATSASFSATVASVSTAQTATLSASAGGTPATFALQLNAAVSTLSVSSSSLNFGSVSVNTATTQTITLSSTGSSAVTISAATVSGSGYSITGATFPLMLNANQSASLTVQFDPTVAGATTGQLALTSNSSTGSTNTISLSGTGVPVLTAISCSSSSMTGSGTDACTVTLNTAAATGGFAVGLSSNNSTVTVPSSVTVAAGATSAGFSATVSSVTTTQSITLSANAGSVSLTFALQLNAAVPTLSVNATTIAFGDVNLNTPATQSITLTSTGTAPVTVNSATVSGTGFSLSGGSFPLTLNPAQTATINVAFDPTAAGAATGQLTISSNSSTNSTASISLSGTGESTSYVITLTWDAPASSPDPVAGYNVYRAPSGSSSYQLVGSVSNAFLTYTDNDNIQTGQTYDYIVESVDASGNTSAPSNMASVAVL